MTTHSFFHDSGACTTCQGKEHTAKTPLSPSIHLLPLRGEGLPYVPGGGALSLPLTYGRNETPDGALLAVLERIRDSRCGSMLPC